LDGAQEVWAIVEEELPKTVRESPQEGQVNRPYFAHKIFGAGSHHGGIFFPGTKILKKIPTDNIDQKGRSPNLLDPVSGFSSWVCGQAAPAGRAEGPTGEV